MSKNDSFVLNSPCLNFDEHIRLQIIVCTYHELMELPNIPGRVGNNKLTIRYNKALIFCGCVFVVALAFIC